MQPPFWFTETKKIKSYINNSIVAAVAPSWFCEGTFHTVFNNWFVAIAHPSSLSMHWRGC